MNQDSRESQDPLSRERRPRDGKKPDISQTSFDGPTEPTWDTGKSPGHSKGQSESRGSQSSSTTPVDLSSEPSPPATKPGKIPPRETRPIRLVEENPEPDPYSPQDMHERQATTDPLRESEQRRPVVQPPQRKKHIISDEGSKVFWDGCSLTFPRSVKPLQGTLITYNGTDYQIAYRLAKKKNDLWKYGLAGVIGAVLVGLIVLFTQPSPTVPLYGTVVNAKTNQVVPQAMISLSNGTTAMSNGSGTFSMASIPPGDYKLQITVPGFKEQTQVVNVPETGPALASVAVQPLFGSEETQTEEQKRAEAEDKREKTAYGAVELKTDFKDYIIYVDDRIQGKNITKIPKMSPGKHTVTLEKPQYEEHRMSVSIRAHRTTHLSVNLADLKQKTTPRQRARKHYADGKEAVDQGLYQAAIRYFDDALAELPDYPEVLQYRGWSLQKYGDLRRASADFEKAAELYALANRYMEAILCTDYLIEIHPDNPVYHLQRGNYHTALNEFTHAIEDYNNAVDRDKRSLEYMLALAEGYYRAGEYKDAAKAFEKARKLTDEPSDVYVRLILAYMYAGKDKDLEKRYEEFVQLVPQERLDQLELDPEWKRVLQVLGPPAIDEQ